MALIRLAKPSDAKSVIEIIAQSSHTPNDYPNNGFVKHQNLDEWCYRRRISSTPFFYCAELLGKVVGFFGGVSFALYMGRDTKQRSSNSQTSEEIP